VPEEEPKRNAPKPTEAETPAREEEAHGAGPPTPSGQEDKFRPEAIAARIDEIGEETEIDKIARQEEQKLLERRKQQKQQRKRGGLEAAASKRLAKIGEGSVKRPTALGGAAIPEADPLLERVARAQKWIREHRQTFGGLVAIALVAGGGVFGYEYWQGKRNAEASSLLAQAIGDSHGHISDKADDEDDDSKPTQQLYPTFKSAADRREAGLAKFRSVETKYGGTGAAILARLGEASLLLDGGDATGALAAYTDVKSSALAQADAEVRGRALEGIGFAHELMAQGASTPGADLDAAEGAFKDLAQADVQGFRELGTYHQARVLAAKGEKEKAIDLLKDLEKKVNEPGDSHPFPYLAFVVEDRLRELDPKALPPKAPAPAKGPGGVDMNDPQVQRLIRQLQQQQKGGAPAVPLPGPTP